MADVIDPLPIKDLVPKSQIGAERFLRSQKSYDGREILIAILDTGVDPGAAGLQVTTTGERKIVDLIDTTGSGDVDTSVLITKEEDGTITGLTGRKLKIPEDWVNPSGYWRIGVKALYELFPKELIARLNSDKVTKEWDPKHRQCSSKAARQLGEFDALYKSNEQLSYEEKLHHADLQAQVDLLQEFATKKQIFPGPVVDCVVFYDGTDWRVVLDTSECGDLASCTLLTPFKESGMFGSFGPQDCLNYSVNVYDNGDVLSIVVPGGSHGTHVASITAGHYPDCPEKNGIAPGAKIVGIKIGNSHLKTMETSSSLVRAATVAAEMKVDLVNFSYGEVAHWVNEGAVLTQFRKLVDNHGAVFVSSSGNNGPCLSSVGTPGGNTSSLIGVAAFVSPEMMCSEYSLIQKKSALPYTWSSRGPTIDGDLGVSIAAPGGAIASVCNYTLRSSQLMNGTSMSSPNACGGIALILSALKAKGIPYNPSLIKKAVENTASAEIKADQFSVGRGILQVDKAVEYLEEVSKSASQSILRPNITVAVAPNLRGIYIREPEGLRKSEYSVTVTPVFPKDEDPKVKLAFDINLALVCSDSWISAPKHLSLQNGARSFTVTVDVESLPEGAHFGEVHGVDTSGGFKGPLFRVPVTVLSPSSLNKPGSSFIKVIEMKKEKLHRYFLNTPNNATYATIELKCLSTDQSSRVCIHAIQLIPDWSFRKTEFFSYDTVKTTDNPHRHTMSIVSGYTLELCVCQWWSEVRDCSVKVKLTFHSLNPSSTQVSLNAGSSYVRIDVKGDLQVEELAPEFKLTHSVQVKRPVDSVVKPLGNRDLLPEGQQMYALNLTYEFSQTSTKSTEVRPCLTLLNDVLYESPYTSQLWMLYNANKQFLMAGDAYRKQYSIKLEKGDYTVKVQIQHTDKAQLDKLKEIPLHLEFALPSSFSLDVYGSLKALLNGSPKFSSSQVIPGQVKPLYIATVPDEKLPKGVGGTEFKGNFVLQKDGSKKNKSPVSYELEYVTVPKASKKSKHSSQSSEDSASKESYEKALKNLKLSWMKKNPEVVSPESLSTEYEEDLDYCYARVQLAESKIAPLKEISELAQKVYSKINIQDILTSLGTKQDFSADASKRQSELEKLKNTLVATYLIEAKALKNEFIVSDPEEPGELDISARMRDIAFVLYKLLSSNESKMKQFKQYEAEVKGYCATVAKLIQEEGADGPLSKEKEQQLVEIYQRLGWSHIADLSEKWILRRHPPDYLLF